MIDEVMTVVAKELRQDENLALGVWPGTIALREICTYVYIDVPPQKPELGVVPQSLGQIGCPPETAGLHTVDDITCRPRVHVAHARLARGSPGEHHAAACVAFDLRCADTDHGQR